MQANKLFHFSKSMISQKMNSLDNQSMNRNTQVKTVDSFRQNAEVCGHCGIKGHNAYHCHKRKKCE